jgi:A/G-specific adenine glycosylase
MDDVWRREFQQRLLEWYDKNARKLPWRVGVLPYRVWVSEIMLQQTRVEPVVAYYERFLTEVPNLKSLAELSEERLFKLWEGLGYYHRALNMQKAARIVMQSFQGELPQSIEALKSLPGIGDYTAGAIASIAFGIRARAVDGNVIRVMARVGAITGNVSERLVKKEIEDVVDKLLPHERVGDFNQALMEIGATVCIPNGAPKCQVCPLNSLCKGFLEGIAGSLPIQSKKKPRTQSDMSVFLIRFENQIAIRKRVASGLLPNLWEFLSYEGFLSNEQIKEVFRQWNMEVEEILPAPSSQHVFTHLVWNMQGHVVWVKNKEESLEWVWSSKEEILKKYSIPSAYRAYVKFILNQ